MDANIFYLAGAAPAEARALGTHRGRWTDRTDGRFVRYDCDLFTAVDSFGDLDQFAASLASTLSLGPLVLVRFPRGGGRVVSFSNSGGSLVNTLTGTTVDSVFPESISVQEQSTWALSYRVTFVKAR